MAVPDELNDLEHRDGFVCLSSDSHSPIQDASTGQLNIFRTEKEAVSAASRFNAGQQSKKEGWLIVVRPVTYFYPKIK